MEVENENENGKGSVELKKAWLIKQSNKRIARRSYILTDSIILAGAVAEAPWFEEVRFGFLCVTNKIKSECEAYCCLAWASLFYYFQIPTATPCSGFMSSHNQVLVSTNFCFSFGFFFFW